MRFYLILLIIFLYPFNVSCQENDLSQQELDEYIVTCYKIIDLINDENLLGVWSFNYWKNQDSTNIRNFINSSKGMIDKYGLPNKDKLKVKTTYSKREGIDNLPIIDLIEIIFPMNDKVEDDDEIYFLFQRSVGASQVFSNGCHFKSTYQDFLDFTKRMEENGQINTNEK